MDFDFQFSYKILLVSFHIISSFSCLCLLKTQLKFQTKTIGTQMMITLALANIIFHLASLDSTFYDYSNENLTTLAIAIYFIMDFAIIFSLFWATTLAYVTYKAISFDEKWDLNDGSKKNNFSILLLPSAALASSVLLLEFLNLNQGLCSFIKLFPVTLSLTCTIYYSVRALRIIKSYPPQIRNALESAKTLLILFPIIQLINVLPFILYAIMSKLIGCSQTFRNVSTLFLSCAGLTNSSIYLFQIKNTLQSYAEQVDGDESGDYSKVSLP